MCPVPRSACTALGEIVATTGGLETCGGVLRCNLLGALLLFIGAGNQVPVKTKSIDHITNALMAFTTNVLGEDLKEVCEGVCVQASV